MSIDPRELMRYYDGDLSSEEERKLEHALENDEAAREHLLATRQVGEAVRAWAERRSAGQQDLVGDVMARVDGARPARAGSGIRSLPRALPIAASALAVAAAIAVFAGTRRPSPAGHDEAVPAAPQNIIVRSSAELAPRAAETGQPVRASKAASFSPAVSIEAVDFGDSHGSIFVLSSETYDTPVVWLSEGPAISAPRTHPL